MLFINKIQKILSTESKIDSDIELQDKPDSNHQNFFSKIEPKTLMKAVMTAGALLCGAGLLGRFLLASRDPMQSSLARREFADQTALGRFDIAEMNVDLEEMMMRPAKADSIFLDYVADMKANIHLVDMEFDARPPIDLIGLGQRMNVYKQDISALLGNIDDIVGLGECSTTPLTSLTENFTAKAPSHALLTAVLREAAGSQAAASPYAHDEAIDHLVGYLPSTAVSRLKGKALGLRDGLVALKELKGQFSDLAGDVLKVYLDTEKELKKTSESIADQTRTVFKLQKSVEAGTPERPAASGDVTALSTETEKLNHAHQKQAELHNIRQGALDAGLRKIKEYVTQQSDLEKEFFLPFEHYVVQFIPNPNSSADGFTNWTLRSYVRTGSMHDLSYRPYLERPASIHEITSKELIYKMLYDGILKHLSSSEDRSIIENFSEPASISLLMPKDKKGSPEFTRMLDQSLPKDTDFQSVLNDILYVELGPEASMDFQIASMKNFAEKNAAVLESSLTTHVMASRSLKSLSYAVERAGTLRYISPEAYAEKTRILQDMDLQLQRTQIKLQRKLRAQSPTVADESDGWRISSFGKVPETYQPLEMTLNSGEKFQTTYIPSLQLSPLEIPVKSEGRVRQFSELLVQLKDVASSSKIDLEIALQTVHGLSAALGRSPQSLDSLSQPEILGLLTHFSDITGKMMDAVGDEQEVALALTEAVVIADLLMDRLGDSAMQGGHLPVHQLVSQMQNNALFSIEIPKHLTERAAVTSKVDRAKLFFGEAITTRQAVMYGSDEMYTTLSWGVLRLKRPGYEAPAHIQYQPLKGRESSNNKCEPSEFLDGEGKPYFNQMQAMVRRAAHYQAKVLAARLNDSSMKITQALRDDPKGVIAGAMDWTQFLNPSVISEMTLEMMTQEQSRQVIESLGRISQAIFSAHFLEGSPFADPKAMVSMLELLALTDKVLAYSNEREHNYYQLPWVDFDEFLHSGNPFFRTFDPAMDLRLQGIRSWFAERKNGDVNLSYITQLAFDNFQGFFNPNYENVLDDDNHPIGDVGGTYELPISYSHFSMTHKLADLKGYYFLGNAGRHGHLDETAMKKNIAPAIEAFCNRDYQFKEDPRSHYQSGFYGTVPQWYYSARDLTHMTYHMMRSGFPLGYQNSDSKAFVPTYEHYYGAVKSSLLGVSPMALIQNPHIPDGHTRGHLFSHLEPRIESEGPIRDIRTLYMQPRQSDHPYSPGIHPLPRLVHDINIVMTEDVESKRGSYSSEAYLAKYALRAQPELQIHSTTGHYISNADWFDLTPVAEQIEFLSLLFDPGLLLKYLQKPSDVGPNGEKDLAHLFYQQYQIRNKKPDEQLYFAELGVRLYQYSALARKLSPEVYAQHPVPSELQQLFDLPKKKSTQKGLSDGERSSYAGLHALTFKTQDKVAMTDEAIIDFLRAVFTYRAYAPIPLVNVMHIDRHIDEMLKEKESQIIAVLYPAGILDHDRIRAALEGIVDLGVKDIGSTNNPLEITDKEGTVSINLREGTVAVKGREGIPLPSEARLSNAYKRIHGGVAYRAKAVDHRTYQFQDGQGIANTIQKGAKDQQWRLYRDLDGGELFQMVSNDWSVWNERTGMMEPLPWLNSRWMLTEYTHWHRGGKAGEVRLLDQQGNLSYRISLKGNAIDKIFKVHAGQQELHLADIMHSDYAWTHLLEDPAYVHVWLSKDQAGRQIEFPRLGKEGVHFTWKDERWKLDSDPQYSVVERQVNPLFLGQKNFLHLKSETKAERLLIPRQRPVWEPGKAVSFDRQTDQSVPQTILSMEKNLKTGKFERTTSEANSYLAMLHFAYGDYARAHQILLGLDHTTRFSEQEVEVLNWIIDAHNQLHRDDFAPAIAVRTAAAYVRRLNVEKHAKMFVDSTNREVVEKYEVPPQLKRLYIRSMDGVSDLRLPVQEELRLFNEHLDVDFSAETLAKMRMINPQAARQALMTQLPKILYGENNIRIDLPETFAQPLSVERVASLPEIMTPEQFNSMVLIEKIPRNISQAVTSIFDFKDKWFKGLPGPSLDWFKKFEKGVLAYHESRNFNRYTLKDRNALVAKKKELEVSYNALAIQMERLKLKILSLANPRPANDADISQYKLQIQSGVRSLVDFEQLNAAFKPDDVLSYFQLNSLLNEEQAIVLDKALQEYKDMGPYWSHHRALISAAKDVLEASSGEMQGALRNFETVVHSGRQFSDDAPRIMKELEYQTESYYRKGQVENLAEIGMEGLVNSPSEASSSVHRITVGAGKTSRLLTTILESFISEGKLALAVMPEAQLAGPGEDFIYIMKTVYGVSTEKLAFSRNDVSIATLEAHLKTIEEAVVNGNAVLCSGESLRILRNLFVDHFDIYNKEVLKKKKYQQRVTDSQQLDVNTESAQRVVLLQKIVNILFVKPLIDEVHKVYDTRIETNHPAGEAKSLPEEFGILALNLYEILDSDPDIRSKMFFNFSSKKPVAGALPFGQQRFTTQIAPLLATKVFSAIQQGQDPELAPLAKFYSRLTKERKEAIQEYLLKKRDHTQWISTLDPMIQDLLGLLRGELNELLPLTLNRNFGEHYGYANAKDVTTTPFSAAGRPNKNSQEKSPFARSNYLLQGVFHEGLRYGMIEKVVADLRKSRLQALQKLSEGLVLGERTETDADREFQQRFQTDDLTLDSPNLEHALLTRLHDKPELTRHVIKTYMLGEVKAYLRNLKATSHHLANLFDGWIGLSGTTNNSPSYPGIFAEPTDETVIGRMLTLVAEQAIGKTHTANFTDVRELFAMEPYRSANAFMDAGGLFALENLETLSVIWGEQTGRAGVTVDSERGVIVRKNLEEKAVSIRASHIVPEERATIYGQADNLGTDILQAKDAVGIVSVSKGMTVTEFEQACGRMRGIETGQRIELLVPENDAVVIRERLGFPLTQALTSKDVIRYLIVNESDKQMTDAEVSLRYNLRGIVENHVFNWLRSSENILGLAGEESVDHLVDVSFFSEVNLSPFKIFGKEKQMISRDEAFTCEIESLVGPGTRYSDAFQDVWKDNADDILQELRSKMESIKSSKLPFVNEEVSSQLELTDLDQQQMLLLDLQLEQQTQQDQELEMDLQQDITHMPKNRRELPQRTFWNGLTTSSIASWNYWQSVNTLQSLPDVLKQSKATEMFADLFDGSLSVSMNYQVDPPLQGLQKPAEYIAIVKNSETGKYKITFIETWEAVQLQKTLEKRQGIATLDEYSRHPPRGQHYNSAKKILKDSFHIDADALAPTIETDRWNRMDWKVTGSKTSEGDCLFWMGDIMSGRKESGDSAAFDISDPAFQRTWLQARVYAGDVDFTSDEKTVIDSWVHRWAENKAKTSQKSADEWVKDFTDAFKIRQARTR